MRGDRYVAGSHHKIFSTCGLSLTKSFAVVRQKTWLPLTLHLFYPPLDPATSSTGELYWKTKFQQS